MSLKERINFIIVGALLLILSGVIIWLATMHPMSIFVMVALTFTLFVGMMLVSSGALGKMLEW